MTWKPSAFNDRLAEAVNSFDRNGAGELCVKLISHLRHRHDAYPFDAAKTVLGLLRRKRYFDLMQRVADAFVQSGQNEPRIRREYAQALLDQSNITAAIFVLTKLIEDTQLSPNEAREHAEAVGLLGRAYKQLYMDASDADIPRNQNYLREAIKAYHGVYKMNPKERLWHGINSVALIRRAERDGVTVGVIADPTGIADAKSLADAMAGGIRQTIKQLDLDGKADMWDFATAVEACVGLGSDEEALRWLARYLKSDYTDAFELASTYRQLTEVWQLSADSSPGDKILPTLRSELLRQQGSQLELTAADFGSDQLAALAQDEGFERILGDETYKSFKWFTSCMERARAVGRVEDSVGDTVGTGFLVRGEDLHHRLGGQLLFLTNNHVVSRYPDEREALRPDQAVLDFELWNGRSPEIKVAEIVWESPRMKLDATLVRLSEPIQGIEPVPIADALPLTDSRQRAYIIGHPKGRKLSFSIHDNFLLDHDDTMLHYRSPTEPGSSGSPVFNEQWALIGLHHKGSHHMRRLHDKEGTYPANEGIWIRAIINQLRGELHH